ncbi:MAG: ParB/RepB/Spo0J family partition protein [Patescibacteria group bacterium]
MPLGRGLGSLIPQQKQPIKVSQETEAPANKEGINYIEVSKIVPNPKQPREYFSDSGMEDLVNSIKIHGILQPLVVSPTKDGFELIAGERRFRAAKLNGMKHVPVIIREVSDHEKLELALIENLQRQNLNPIEEAAGYEQLMDEFGFTQDEVSKRMGKSRPVVANMLRLLSLPEEIKKAIAQGKISSSAGRVLAGVKDTDKQMDLFKKMLSGLTVREGEITSQLSKPAAHTKRVIKDPYLADLEDKLRGVLETKVDIKKSGKTGKIIIEFYSEEELKKLKDKLL